MVVGLGFGQVGRFDSGIFSSGGYWSAGELDRGIIKETQAGVILVWASEPRMKSFLLLA